LIKFKNKPNKRRINNMINVICKQCGKKISSVDAIKVQVGKKNYKFCNDEEKEMFLNNNNKDNKKNECYKIIFDIFERPIPIVYKVFKELSDKYSWTEIQEALNKVKQSIEKYSKEKYTTDFALSRYIETCINNVYNNETEKTEKLKFHVIKSKKLAIAINYIIEEDYYELDDKFNEGWKYYSFVETERFIKTLNSINKLKEDIEVDR